MQGDSSIFLAGARGIAKGKNRSEDKQNEAKSTKHQNQLINNERYQRTIGVDLMGGDHPPPVLLDALKNASLDPSVQITAIGLPEFAKRSPFAYAPAPEFIGMEENPLTALRRKKNSSLILGLRLLKEGKIDAFVSAGNTGALVTGAKLILGTIFPILRPALLAQMPTKKQPVAVLDVGANVSAKANLLVQFAYLGAAYSQARGIDNPSIGMLNIGSEAVKGTSELRLAYHALQNLDRPPFRFAGNIEGTSVFDGEVDALITDGFTGNVFLKTSEGIASLFLDRFKMELSGAEIGPKIKDLQKHLHYAEYPGALLAGVNGLVIKCHGYSTPQAFVNGVRGAIELAQEDFGQVFQNKLDQFRLKRKK